MVMIKSRATPLVEAVAAIPDGAAVALGGFLHHRHPMAVVRELIRQRRRGLRVVAPIGGIDVDMLIAAGAVDHVTFGFISLEAVGMAPAFMAATQAGRLGISEHGDLTLVRALQAKHMRVPWVPVRTWIGSDMEEHHAGWRVRMDDTQQEYWATPPVEVEFGIIHAPYATAEGDFLIWGEGFDGLIAKAADRVLVTAEQLVSFAELRSLADRIGNACTIGNYSTEWVVQSRFGAHPSSCYPLYNGDLQHEIEYYERVSAGAWDRYARQWIAADEDEYVSRIGEPTIDGLVRRMQLAIDLGRRHADGKAGVLW